MMIAPGTTLVDHIIPARSSKSASLLQDGLLVVGFSIFLALCAQVSFYLPITPVPVTLQTLAVLLTGAALGSRRGALAMLAYLAEGAAGLPVFAGASGGFIHLIGYTGGYLWSYPIAAFIVGLLCEKGLDRRFLTSALAMLPSAIAIDVFGTVWLAVVLHLDILTALQQGIFPFIRGDLLKLVVATALLPIAWMMVRAVKPTERRPRA
jgi:biotin transport system substrate-specific component